MRYFLCKVGIEMLKKKTDLMDDKILKDDQISGIL